MRTILGLMLAALILGLGTSGQFRRASAQGKPDYWCDPIVASPCPCKTQIVDGVPWCVRYQGADVFFCQSRTGSECLDNLEVKCVGYWVAGSQCPQCVGDPVIAAAELKRTTCLLR